jgi:hypothetical protein
LGKIENNPGKRAVAKICLNSLWGKFGQRQNMGATEYVTDVKRFYEILLDEKLDNIRINDINENMLQIGYKLKDCYVENDFNTNIPGHFFNIEHSTYLFLCSVLKNTGQCMYVIT